MLLTVEDSHFWTPALSDMDPTWTPHGPHINPTWTLHGPHMDPWKSLEMTGLSPLRQVLDQTAELKEDSGIYDALGCQAQPRQTADGNGGPLGDAAQLRKRRSGPLSPCFVWDGLFAHLGTRHCSCGGFRVGILGRIHRTGLLNPGPFELRTTTST